MVAKSFIQSNVNMKKLQTLVNKLNTHVKNEKIINRVSITRVKNLLTFSDPLKTKENFKEIVDAKEAEIKVLKSKLRIPHQLRRNQSS
jgi:hypothetical protein